MVFENEFIQEEALAYELAAKHYLARVSGKTPKPSYERSLLPLRAMQNARQR